jgi:PadR family transcriptional regulator, regulatory protein PadR
MKEPKAVLKGSLSVIILKLLQDQQRMYGYEITQKVKEMTAGDISITEGALYPTLHRLEAEDLLTSTSEIVEGRARKYYSLTQKGNEKSVTAVEELQSFLQNIQRILNPKLA